MVKIGAYQFAVTSDIKHNLEIVKNSIIKAAQEGVKLLVFPECALTGYPPRDIENSSVVNFYELDYAYEQLQSLVDENEIHIMIGAIIREDEKYHNSAIAFSPHKEKQFYHKRALWGWDRDNFTVGDSNGIFEIDGWKIGVRICFEVRFPEFFRELYNEHTDLNIIMFYDVADFDDKERYELIKAHIRTRAVENVTYTLSVDTICPYQTAPTALYDKSGYSFDGRKILEEHVKDFNEILLHVLAGDLVTEPLIDLFMHHMDRKMEIQIYCNAIEVMWKNGDDEVVNVVDVTILERLSDEACVWQRFGTFLSEEFRNYVNNEVLSFNLMMGGVKLLGVKYLIVNTD